MNITLPKKEKTDTKAIVIYTISIISCIIAVIIVCASQYLGTNKLEEFITIGTSGINKQEVENQIPVTEFTNLFNNQLEGNILNTEIKKIDEDKDIVYTYYTKSENKENNYDLNLQIPYINIDNDIIKNYNKEIKEIFEKKAENVLVSKNRNIIYTVKYQATIDDDILSLMIKSELKEGISAQRLIIKTYNYDLKNNKEIKLEDAISKKGFRKEDVQSKIKSRIKLEEKKVEDLKNLGYSIFERNSQDIKYDISNTKEFFIKNQQIYIIYPYGNENLTSEMDLIII